jgi:hypothetical protein
MGDVGPALEPYVAAAREFAEVHLHDLAQSVGGGRVGPGVASLVQSAALALAASRAMYAEGSRTGDHRLLGQAAQLADKSRVSILTAHELAAREAAARPRSPASYPWMTAPLPAPVDDDEPDSETTEGSS